jgi:hypothetical protein
VLHKSIRTMLRIPTRALEHDPTGAQARDHKSDSLVGEAVVVKVDLLDALLEDGHDVVERAETVLVVRAPGVALVDRENGVVTAQIRERGSSCLHATQVGCVSSCPLTRGTSSAW